MAVTQKEGTVTLDYYKGEAAANGGSVIYSKMGHPTLTPFYMSSITVDTKLNYTEYAMRGVDNPVTILGMGERNCSIVGSFQVLTSSFINLSSLWDIQPGNILGGNYVAINPSSLVKPYELTSYWMIESFKPDRNAIKMGRPDFQLDLKYAWSIKAESLLFKW